MNTAYIISVKPVEALSGNLQTNCQRKGQPVKVIQMYFYF